MLWELKDIKITAINSYKDQLIIGDAEGNVQTYEITSKNKMNETNFTIGFNVWRIDSS